MPAAAGVVIIGAGVIGVSTAYHLAAAGITDVTVVEMDQVGSGTSTKSASMLSLQFYTDELTLRMAQYSYDRYMHFAEELGTPIDFKRTGWLSLATSDAAAGLRETARQLQAHGVTTEVLSPEEIAYRYPEIHTADLALGTYGPDDGPFDPHMILWGYVRGAREKGVRLLQGVRATGMQVQAGQVVAVETTQGIIDTPLVVNAAGPWAAEVGRWAGVEIPLRNRARCIWVTRPFPDLPGDRPFVEDLAAEWYYRPEGPGLLIGMGLEPVDSFDVHLGSQLLGPMIEVATHRVPLLERAAIQTSWTGIRPLTPDDHPILGPVPGVEGLVLNCGWGGLGLVQAPVAGQLIAEYISAGRGLTFDLAPLGLARFCGDGPV